jgi:PadR family transcriptional regulator, regulatory protein PadR
MLPKALVAASLEPIMLSLLSRGEMYGYEIIQEVHKLSDGRIKWTASKLYPVLHRLENDSRVQAVWRPSESGPDRKYYRLTPKGQKALEATKQNWVDLNAILVRLWGPELLLRPAGAS